MARGQQLQELIAQLRAETGRDQSVSVGVSELDNFKVQLARVQEVLYDEYEWPFLRVERSLTLSAGQRYYDFPSDLNYDRLMCVKLKRNGVYTDMQRGITFDEFSVYDSNADERSSPAQKWDVRNTGAGEQLEVWPIPNEEGSLHFFGTKSLSPLVANEDRADLDDRLIVLFAAAEVLARQKSPDAQNKMNLANARLLKLRSNSQAANKMVQIGLGNKDRSTIGGKTVLVVR